MSLKKFKIFVKNNPKLLNYVKTNEMTWQKFYEMYDMYGEENEVWNEYLKPQTNTNTNIGVKDIANYFKNINLDTLQESISSIQRVLGVVGDLTNNKQVKPSENEYEPRPLYKHFDD